jgi:glycosyltransferase involved in cell wall biosynthesis
VETADDAALPNVEADLCRHDYANVPVVRKLRASRSLRSLLSSIVPDAALVHVHGIWLMPNVQAGEIAHRCGRPLVVSPRGMLASEALKFSRILKVIFWKLLQEGAYANAALWHATSDAEAEEIRAFGVRAPIAVIPNGIDVPASMNAHCRSATTDQRERTVLFLGRVHPKKNLTSLVEAWALVSAEFPDWRLRIVGPDENGHAGELRNLADRLGARRVSVEPAVFDSLKSEALSDATIFVLPTLNENFGIAVAEALGASVPAIVTKGAPWSGLQAERCGWWIDHGVGPLAEALRTSMRMAPVDLREMGERGCAWMRRDFGWDRIAHDMLAVYGWITQGGAPPATVRLN